MTETIKGLWIGAALVAGYAWWTRRAPIADGRRSSSLCGATPTSTLAASWSASNARQAAWMAAQSIVAPPGGGQSGMTFRGIAPPPGGQRPDGTGTRGGFVGSLDGDARGGGVVLLDGGGVINY